MLTTQALSEMTVEHTRQISALENGIDALEKRVDSNDLVTQGIHKLAANTENLTIEVKRLGEKLEHGLREQGKRIGSIEATIIQMPMWKEDLQSVSKRISALEQEPAHKWRTLIAQITTIIVAALLGFVISWLS